MDEQKAIIVLTGRHRPHELLFLFLSALSGLVYMLGLPPPPASPESHISPSIIRVWAIGLFVSGVVGLVACLWPMDMVRSLYLELSSMLMGSGALLVYAASIATFGMRGAFGAGFTLTWIAANLVRSAQIRSALREQDKPNGRN